MRLSAERLLVIAAAAISITLTAITVSAVLRQSETLSERESAALRDSATRAAQERVTELRATLNRLFAQAAGAWAELGVDALDAWSARHPDWPLFLLETGDGWTALPLSPAGNPPAWRTSDELLAAAEIEFAEQDPAAALERLERLAERSADRGVRISAMVAAASVRKKLRQPQAAARAFRDVLPQLEQEPALARGAFAVKLAMVECWLAAREYALAREALLEMLRAVNSAHPGRHGQADVAMMRSRVTWLRARSPSVLATPAEREIDERTDRELQWADARAARRDQLSELEEEMRRLLAKRTQPSEGVISFVNTRAGDIPVILALRAIGPDRRLAVVMPTQELIERYWYSARRTQPWRVVMPEQVGGSEMIVALGEPFGGALVVPTLETLQRSAEQSSQRLVLLLAITVAAAGGWGIVLWMLSRSLARQRELAALQRRFVADVSHELKTPLALIRLLTETLADGRVSDPQRVSQYLGTIGRESERLTNLLDTILDFSRMESGRRSYVLRACDVGGAVRAAWALFEPRFAADGFTAELHVADDLPMIAGDAEALQQLVVNLLQNAYRYAGDARYVRVDVQRERGGGAVVIMVQDRGIGMSKAQLRRIGDSFYRAEDARVRSTRGAGLGLAIVRHVVAAHRGRMDVISRPGRGSTFTVTLPVGRIPDESASAAGDDLAPEAARLPNGDGRAP
ncbi:MAG: ATP-binding protein [Phycisphaerales bacterium]|nr:ATP-binding protein [Phycisphaerales bacterium]